MNNKNMQVKKQETALDKMSWEVMKEQATTMIRSNFLPSAVRTPEQAMAIALTGRELGLGLMASFRSINVIQGKPTFSANLMKALASQTGLLEWDKVEYTPSKENCKAVIYTVKRKGHPEHISEFGEKEAREMGLLGKDNYKKQAGTMFLWRAVSAGLRFKFPEALHGIYTPEELAPDDVKVGEDGEPIVEAKTVEPPKTATKPQPKTEPTKPVEKKPIPKTEEFTDYSFVPYDVTKKTSKNGKPFWVMRDKSAENFFTFSETVGPLAEEAELNKQQINSRVKTDKYGNKIVEATPGALEEDNATNK